MSNFDQAFDYMIQYEGDKFSDNPNDKGGPTKYGISYRFIDGLDDEDLLLEVNLLGELFISHKCVILRKNSSSVYINMLTIEQAKWIYKTYFWLPIYDSINDTIIQSYIFDMAVNHGHKNAAIIVQRAIKGSWSITSNTVNIKEDGIIGSKTLDYLNFDKIAQNLYPDLHEIYALMLSRCFISSLRSERAGFMRCIVVSNPSQKVFLKGWLNRAYGSVFIK